MFAEVRSAKERDYYNFCGQYSAKPWVHPEYISKTSRKPPYTKYPWVGIPKGPKIDLDQERLDELERRIIKAARRICGAGWSESEEDEDVQLLLPPPFVSVEVKNLCIEVLSNSLVRATQPTSSQNQIKPSNGWCAWRNHNNLN